LDHLPLLSPLSGLVVSGNSLSIQLDPRMDNDLMLTSEGILGIGLKTDGTSEMTANINMNSNQINNLSRPTLATDCSTKGYVDSLVSNIFTHLFYSILNQSASLTEITLDLNVNNLFVVKTNSSVGSNVTSSTIFKLDPTLGTMLTYLPIPLYTCPSSLFSAPLLSGYLNVLYDKTSNLLQIYFVNLPGSTITSYNLYIYFLT